MQSSICTTALWFFFLGTVATAGSSSTGAPGAQAYTAPAGFPTSAFSSYYLNPAKPTAEPQPAIYDPVFNRTYPENLTNPNTLPTKDNDPIFFPDALVNLSSSQTEVFIQGLVSQIKEIISNDGISGNCSKCIAALSVAKSAATVTPRAVPDAMVSLCKLYKFHNNETCEENFDASTFGSVWTQVLRFADVGGWDGRQICNSLSSTFCPRPITLPSNTTALFPKPKPASATAPKPSGKRVKVLHMSDFHLDPRKTTPREIDESNCDQANVIKQATLLAQKPIHLWSLLPY